MTRTSFPWSRLGFSALVVVSLGLGWWGLALDTSHLPGRTWYDVVYHDLQLFVMGADPASGGGPLSWQLQVARFLAPATAVYALFEAARALFTGEIRRFRDRRARGHAIVVGQTDAADTVTAALEAAGHRVLRTADAAGLGAAGLTGATVLYACGDDTEEATANVLTVAEAENAVRRSGRGPERLYAHVSDPELGVALQARHLSCAEPGVDFFTLDVIAAQALAVREVRRMVDGPGGPAARTRVAVVGSGEFAKALVVGLAREWELAGDGARLTVDLIADDAEAVTGALRARWSPVAEKIELRAAAALGAGVPGVPDVVYVCHASDGTSLRVALTATKLWHGGPGSLVLLLDGLAGLSSAFGTEASRVLDNLDGRLRTVTMRDLLADVEREEARAHADMYERIARSVHHVYLRNQLERGVAWGEVPAMVRWEDLPEDLRASNRGWVVGLPERLARMGATIAPRDGAAEVVFEGVELDRLAEAEHELWESVRVAQGWRSGPVRDDAARVHPMIGMPWSELPEVNREKDRDVVRLLPEILAEFGLEVVRYEEGRVLEALVDA
ncbi:RyR domain-containing protein [Promicromonospora umidemergens]|uniref:Ryanodine receptor Ryr domain-containing protein n=1 Tax=Promicromonospora umidemergens TaxID=629679 RepID=A0ABP8WYW8_9MICO|nr:RyR domain-containing protein [Promicromonospora umidemergens]MCP2285782.1 RyR domain-containing protein [Promicromonospora umidemergens]